MLDVTISAWWSGRLIAGPDCNFEIEVASSLCGKGLILSYGLYDIGDQITQFICSLLSLSTIMICFLPSKANNHENFSSAHRTFNQCLFERHSHFSTSSVRKDIRNGRGNIYSTTISICMRPNHQMESNICFMPSIQALSYWAHPTHSNFALQCV